MTRINKFIAQLSGISRRSADKLIDEEKVLVNGKPAQAGYQVKKNDKVTSIDPSFKFDHKGSEGTKPMLLLLNKPEGYVCSRKGQGNKTVYNLLPAKYHRLKSVGRLDKDSSGLLLMTNDGNLANKLTHPKYQKEKVYLVKLNKPLALKDKNKLLTGVKLEDGMSKFIKIKDCSNSTYEVALKEGRNRQIRRTFNTLSYKVIKLHRISLGAHRLEGLLLGEYKVL